MSILSVYIAKSCWLLLFECSVHVSDQWVSKIKSFDWWWVGGVSSIQVFFGNFWKFLTLQSP